MGHFASSNKPIPLKLLQDPENHEEGGLVLSLPSALQAFVCPWANPVYREYDFGYTLVQELIEKEFAIFNWRIWCAKSCRLHPTSDKAMIALQFNLGDPISCILHGYGPKLLERSTQELFYVPEGANEALFDMQHHESLHIELEPSWIEDTAEAHPAIKVLLEMLKAESTAGRPLIAAPISFVSRHIIGKLKSCKKTGGDLRLDMQIFILALLSQYVEELKNLEKDLALKPIANKDLMIRLKQEIMSSPNIKAHSMKKLSVKFAINGTTLKSNFKSLFGIALKAFVRSQALNRAYYLISTTKPVEMSIEDISGEVGYPYRSNFNRAFKKQFSCLPHTLREDTGDPV